MHIYIELLRDGSGAAAGTHSQKYALTLLHTVHTLWYSLSFFFGDFCGAELDQVLQNALQAHILKTKLFAI